MRKRINAAGWIPILLATSLTTYHLYIALRSVKEHVMTEDIRGFVFSPNERED